MSWQNQAICAQVGSEIFFATTGENDLYVAAKRVCSTCPVVEPCLEAAWEEEKDDMASVHGVRGGVAARNRRIMWMRRRSEESPAA